MYFLYTLDSHDCYGPFHSTTSLHNWAKNKRFRSYQVLNYAPYSSTFVHYPA
jgi:hypothetical protein